MARDEDARQRYLQNIVDEAERLRRLTTDLLDLRRPAVPGRTSTLFTRHTAPSTVPAVIMGSLRIHRVGNLISS